MASEEQLSSVLSEFARTMVTDFPIQGILDHLVERIVDVMPITAAGVTLISDDADPRYVAASDDSALRFEKLQTELGEGPCLLAYQTGEAVSVPDLRDDPRFPRFAPRALDAGLAAVFTFPLRSGEEQLGALDLYRSTPGRLDGRSMEAAQTLADVAAAYLLNAQARSDLRDSADQSRESALHDALTGLPNRTLLLDRLERVVVRGRRSRKIAAVLFADLDRFKLVNDQYGHSVGDELLVAVVKRLSDILRPGDTLARMSGDEFVILCEDLDDVAQVDAIAVRVGAALEAPFVLSGAELKVTASVGVAFAGQGDQLSEQILQDADTAMYQAKRKGGAQHQIIDLREQHQDAERANLEQDLWRALTRAELRMEYQPIIETADTRIIGVEALLRWNHPTRGLLAPAVFLPLAERSGLITEIGRWVLEQASLDHRRWKCSDSVNDMTTSVNVSTHELMSPDFATSVASVLSDTDIAPGVMTLDITESAFVLDSERALVVLRDLKDIGVQIALDDFGTGYSSLSYLKRFPLDVVKLDHVLVADLERDEAGHAIVSAVIELAHLLGMTVVSEGVETAQQHRLLDSLGCDRCQGFYFARPMPADDLEAMMQPLVAGEAVHLPALAATRS
jgi:diguanylate cyclase (GGDEF)-like protein